MLTTALLHTCDLNILEGSLLFFQGFFCQISFCISWLSFSKSLQVKKLCKQVVTYYLLGPKQTTTENIPIFEPDFPLDLGRFFPQGFCVFYSKKKNALCTGTAKFWFGSVCFWNRRFWPDLYWRLFHVFVVILNVSLWLKSLRKICGLGRGRKESSSQISGVGLKMAKPKGARQNRDSKTKVTNCRKMPQIITPLGLRQVMAFNRTEDSDGIRVNVAKWPHAVDRRSVFCHLTPAIFYGFSTIKFAVWLRHSSNRPPNCPNRTF